MIQLTKNMIRNLASSEKVFMRGMQYYQNGRIQNASYSKTHLHKFLGTVDYMTLINPVHESMPMLYRMIFLQHIPLFD